MIFFDQPGKFIKRLNGVDIFELLFNLNYMLVIKKDNKIYQLEYQRNYVKDSNFDFIVKDFRKKVYNDNK